MQEFGKNIDAIFVWVILLAIVATIVSTRDAPQAVKDFGKAMAAMIGIIVNPAQGSAK